MVRRTKKDEELWGRFKRRFTRREWVRFFGGHAVISGGIDTTAPTVVITSPASMLTATPFTCTFTFSEDVTGFTLGDITVSANASAGTFTTVSASVYTAVITPTSAGTVTVDVGAAVCVDGAGNSNNAATQFSIVSLATATLWLDASDITKLFKDDLLTTPVTADADTVGGWQDKSASGNNAIQATEGNRPTYKVNIKNGRSALLIGSADGIRAPNLQVVTGSALYAVVSGCTESVAILTDAGAANILSMRIATVAYTVYSGLYLSSGVVPSAAWLIWQFLFNTTSYHNINGVDRLSGSAGTNTGTGMTFGSRNNLTNSWLGYLAEFVYFPVAPAAAARTAIQNVLNAKWAVF